MENKNRETEEQRETPAASEVVLFRCGRKDFRYLRERIGGNLVAITWLAQEAFGYDHSARIPAALLRQRLPEALELIEFQARHLKSQEDRAEIAKASQCLVGFVNAIEKEEKKTGQAVKIILSDCR